MLELMVPILNFIEKHSGFEIDISINASSGIDGRSIIKKFIQQCPAIKPLNIVLKQFLELIDLNKVFTGGLSSYALTLMVISFLQIHPLVRSGRIDPMNNLGMMLIEFLELYGVCFNHNKVGITLTNGGRYYKRSIQSQLRRPASVSTIEILDPQDESNNVSSGSRNYREVAYAFRGGFITLTKIIQRYHQRDSSLLFEQPLLGTILHIPTKSIAQRQMIPSAYGKLGKQK